MSLPRPQYHPQRALGPFTQAIDNFYLDFNEIADDYLLLPTERLYNHLPHANTALTSPAEISRAASVLQKELPSLEFEKLHLQAFEDQAAALGAAFTRLATDGDLQGRAAVPRFLDLESRERFAKFFGAMGMISGLRDDVERKLQPVDWYLELAKRKDTGSAEWAATFG